MNRTGPVRLACCLLLSAAAFVPVGGSAASARADVVMCHGLRATIVGTDGRDDIVGTSGRDVIAGRGGADTIQGGRGHDVICGGGGADRLFGGAGFDTLVGGRGDDRIFSRPTPTFVKPRSDGPVRVQEYVYGRQGDDRISGNWGAFYGGNGDDVVRVQGHSSVAGGGGDDRLLTVNGADMSGGHGDDHLRAGDGNSNFRGGPGDDTFIGGDGNDRVVDQHGKSVVRLGDGDAPGGIRGFTFDNGVYVAGDDSTVRTGSGSDAIVTIGARTVVHTGGGSDNLMVTYGRMFAGRGHDDFYLLTCDPCRTGQSLDLRGGDGADQIYISHHDPARALDLAVTNLAGGAGTDLLWVNLSDEPGTPVVEVSLGSAMTQPWDATITGIENYRGDSGTQTVTGTNGPNEIDVFGLPGSAIYGLGGDDDLEGAYTIDGGRGNDRCSVYSGGTAINCEVSLRRRATEPKPLLKTPEFWLLPS